MRYWLGLIILIFLAGCVQQGTPETQTGANPESQGGYSQTAALELAGPQAEMGDTARVNVIGGDEVALRKFIQDYFTQTYPGAPAQEVTVFIGRLPDRLPVDLPLPEDAKLVASIEGQYSTLEVLFDSEQNPESVAEFYRQELASAGWQPPARGEPGPGFVSSNEYGSVFCRNEGETSLMVQARERPEGATLTRLTLYTGSDYHMCAQPEPPGGTGDPAQELVPPMEAPAGARMFETGGGGGSGRYEYTAGLETSLSAGELAVHYDQQLSAAGWQKLKEGSGDGLAWSTWSLKDKREKTWGGFLLITENQFDPDRRFALFRIEQAP